MAGRIRNSKLERFVLDEIKNIRTNELTKKCPYCGLQSNLLYKVQSAHNYRDVYDYYKCDACDFIFLGDEFNEYLNSTYVRNTRQNNFTVQDEFFSANENYRNPDYMYNYWSREMKQIIKLGKVKGKILDIGCASGQFLDKFNDKFEKYGIEVSDLATIAKAKNINVSKDPIENLNFKNDFFDVISAYALIEHLEDPFGFIDKITPWLKPGGLLVLGTNDINSLLNRYRKQYCQDFIPPEHIVLFSHNFYKNFLKQKGFRIIFKKYINGGYTFSDNKILHLLEFIIGRLFFNRYPFNQLPIYDHFYIYAVKVN